MSIFTVVHSLAALLDADQLGIPKANANNTFSSLLGAAYWIAGILAVVIIIVAGFMYVTSGGDAAKVVKAKNTILYTIIGLVIIILAFTIVGFITGSFS